MTDDARYPVPASTHRTVEEIRRSRFITTVERVASVEEADAFVKRISAEFADATHNCYAFVVGPPGSTGRIGMSDDGEPHGTAGRPMLTVLLHSGIGDVAAVVTRYYGGTKLGTGGLVRAYSGCVQHALAELPLGERVELVPVTVAVDYASASAVSHLFGAHEVDVVDERYAEDVTYELRLPRGRLDAFRDAVLDATRGRARLGGDGLDAGTG
ncbi:MAG TPA: YigZ family protein [Gemmatimonadaceae bacterium]|nr:YigZ family protein [Gemmatimonadaceae bacterium]